MHSATRARANTRIEQKVFGVIGLLKTDFTLWFFLIVLDNLFIRWIVFHDISTGVDSGFIFAAGSVGFSIDTSLANKELNSSKLNDLSRFEFVPQILAILFF